MISKSEEYSRMSGSLHPLHPLYTFMTWCLGTGTTYVTEPQISSPHNSRLHHQASHITTTKFIQLSQLRSILRLYRPLALPKMSTLIASIFLCLIYFVHFTLSPTFSVTQHKRPTRLISVGSSYSSSFTCSVYFRGGR
jgi:hypothetical protein